MRAFALAFSLLLVACGGDAAATGADYSSPEATVKTLIAACAAKDKAAVAACFATTAEGEFKPLVDQSASDDQWTEFFEFFAGATVTGSKDNAVEVKAKRDETINLVKEGDAFKVVGF